MVITIFASAQLWGTRGNKYDRVEFDLKKSETGGIAAYVKSKRNDVVGRDERISDDIVRFQINPASAWQNQQNLAFEFWGFNNIAGSRSRYKINLRYSVEELSYNDTNGNFHSSTVSAIGQILRKINFTPSKWARYTDVDCKVYACAN